MQFGIFGGKSLRRPSLNPIWRLYVTSYDVIKAGTIQFVYKKNMGVDSNNMTQCCIHDAISAKSPFQGVTIHIQI